MSPMEIIVRPAQSEDREEWTRMRATLWPDSSAESHAEEIAAFLSGDLTGWLAGLQAVAVLVAVRPAGGLCGFVEASIRPMVDGCTTHPVGYVEGWYVDPDLRRQGVGRRLVAAAEAWAASQGCREMASDAHLANSTSIAAHKALGFHEEAPTVRFRKWLPATDGERKAEVKQAHQWAVVPLDGIFAVCRLSPDAPLPTWVACGPVTSITRTADELSVVCRQDVVPESVRCERGWRCLRVAGTLDFSLVGVLASLLGPLANAGVSVFVLSTFDTDYLLVKEDKLEKAIEVLSQAGQRVCPRPGETQPSR
jgi:GNAT superfamily N-acetyltransferase